MRQLSSKNSIQYPAQLGKYAVKVKNGAFWRDYNTVRLEISVGALYNEGDKFLATCEWVKHRFDNVVILVNDTLQRHNLIISGMDQGQAMELSRTQGKQWMERNLKHIHNIDGFANVHIYRWDDWLARDGYNDALTAAHNEYINNHEWRKLVNSSIDEYLSRQKSIEDLELYKRQSFLYYMEETAVLSAAYSEYKGVSAYSGNFHDMWGCFISKTPPMHLEGLSNAQCIRIDFKKRK